MPNLILWAETDLRRCPSRHQDVVAELRSLPSVRFDLFLLNRKRPHNCFRYLPTFN